MPEPTNRSDQVNGVYLVTGGAHKMYEAIVEIRKNHPGQSIHTAEFDGAEHRFLLVIANPDKDGEVASTDVRKIRKQEL